MRKLLLVIGCFVFVMLAQINQTQAQDNVLKVNPLALIKLDAEVYFERVIGDRTSAVVGASLGTASIEEVKHNNISLLGEYRIYFDIGSIQSDAPAGIYAAPFTRIRYSKSPNGDFSFASIGAIAGYQYLINDRFAIDVFVGPYMNVKFSESTDVNTDAARYNGKSGLRFGVSAGIAF